MTMASTLTSVGTNALVTNEDRSLSAGVTASTIDSAQPISSSSSETTDDRGENAIVPSKTEDENDCHTSMLDGIDRCVGCVDGVEFQHVFEEKLGHHQLIELPTTNNETMMILPSAAHHHQSSLSQTEAALIRLQIMEKQELDLQRKQAQLGSSATTSTTATTTLTNSACTITGTTSDAAAVGDGSDDSKADGGHNSLAVIGQIDLLNICGKEEDSEPTRSTGQLSYSIDTKPHARIKHVCAEADTTVESYETEGTEATLDGSFISTNEMLDTSARADATGRESETILQCAICFDEVHGCSTHTSFAKLPCCSHAEATSSIKICNGCIILLTTPTDSGDSRIGHCPRCRAWIVVRTPTSAEDKELEISTVAVAGKCQVCCQVKEQLVEDSSVCDACFLGRRKPLLYECQHCHVTQRIPHPMYRYQSKPNEFGNVTWACQGRCGTFTHWRVRADQLSLIPVGDFPAQWGEDYLEAARERVKEARNVIHTTGHEGDASSCVIL